MKIFDGTYYSKQLDVKISEIVNTFYDNKVLYIIQIGENEVSQLYIKYKLNYCKKIGIRSSLINLNYKQNLHDEILNIMNRYDCGGVVIQLPLKNQFKYLLNLIPEKFDCDLLSSVSRENFFKGVSVVKPPAVEVLEFFLKKSQLYDKNIDITSIGNGYLIGSVCNFYLENSIYEVKLYDGSNLYENQFIDSELLITSAGVPKLVNPKNVKAGCSVIDFGNSYHKGRIYGDFNSEEDFSHLNHVCISPGGVGPLTIRFLIMNFLKLNYNF